jgi:hypothetical protein
MSQKFFQELVTSRKNYPGGDGIVGQVGRLWFENETNSIRISDGVRTGGRIVANGVYYNNSTNSLMWTDPDTNIEYVIASAGPRAANQLTNGSVTLTLNSNGSVSFPHFTFPSADGEANQVLATDGAGHLSWRTQSGGGGNVSISDNAPASPTVGDLWYNSNEGRTYIYYDNTWVNSAGDAKVTVAATAPRVATTGDLWFDTAHNITYIYYNSNWVNSVPVNNFAITVNSTAPRTPNEGDLWYDTGAQTTKIYVSTSWISTNPSAGGFSGDYNDLTNRPVLANVATSGSYNDLTDKPNLGPVINTLTDIPDVYTGGAGMPMLQDGVTLIYAAGMTRWETKPIDTAQINLNGGEY